MSWFLLFFWNRNYCVKAFTWTTHKKDIFLSYTVITFPPFYASTFNPFSLIFLSIHITFFDIYLLLLLSPLWDLTWRNSEALSNICFNHVSHKNHIFSFSLETFIFPRFTFWFLFALNCLLINNNKHKLESFI